MDQVDWLFLKRTPLFGVLPRDVADWLIEGGGARAYDKGVVLFQQGTPAEHCYFVLDGWVKVFRSSPAGQETVVHVFRPGEIFAEAVIFMGGKYPVSAETATTCRLMRINGKRLRDCMRETPDLALSMLASASQHLKVLVSQIDQMKRLNAPQRLADFLLSLCPGEHGACSIKLPYEKSLIADRLGIKPESLSRALAQLKPLGVTVLRDEIAVADVGRLRTFIEEDGEQLFV
jgi:CRP-like cAMP-binding protein